MRLFAALVPPEGVRHELAATVEAVAPRTAELAPVAVADMRIPVTSFGNVALSDADQLMRLLRNAAAAWPPAEVRLQGSAALEWPGDENVWSRLHGDLDALFTIGRGVPVAVKSLGFLVDRRAFRPWLAAGSITTATTAPYLEKLVAALDDFTGSPWQVDRLSVMLKTPGATPCHDHVVLHDEVALGG